MRMRKNYSELAIQVSQPTSFALNKARSHAKSFVVEKGAGFTHAQTGGYWHREGLTRNGKFCVIS